MRIKTLVALYFWILEFDDVRCIRSIDEKIVTSIGEKNTPLPAAVCVSETSVLKLPNN